MFKSKNKRKLKSISILFLFLGTMFVSLNVSQTNLLNRAIEEETKFNYDEFDFFDDNLKAAGYTNDLSNTGENVNVTLHQSYFNESFNWNLNASDSNNNTFNIASPGNNNFFAKNISIEVMDIVAPNKTLVIETGTTLSTSIRNYDHAVSFQVPGDGILDNFTMCFSESDLLDDFDGSINLELWSASWNGVFSDYGPDTYLDTIQNSVTIYNDTNRIWYNFTDLDIQLDVSQTENNLFYIWMTQTTSSSLANVQFHDENDGSSDDSKVWIDDGGWQPVAGIDPSLILHLLPLNNTPTPNQVSLKINGSAVDNYNSFANQGTWDLDASFEVVTNSLNFEISAEWWDVTCQISEVQANYTKSDITAASNFTLTKNAADVNWMALPTEEIDDFDSRLSNFYINFTVPDTWRNFNAYNGSIDKTSDITIGPIINRFKDLKISNADNGTNWYITGQSDNLLQSIGMNKGLNPITEANYSDTVSFVAEFFEDVIPGTNGVNLSIYSPILINDFLNFTTDNTTLSANSDINFIDWDISSTVVSYGVFRVQVFWNNETAAGFREELLTIYGETDLSHISPPDNEYYYPSSPDFNITVYINDTGQNIPVDGTIEYSINGGTWDSTSVNNGTSGFYNITIDPSSANYGPNTVDIRTLLQYYNNDSLQFIFNLVNHTFIEDITKSFQSTNGVNVTYTFNYTDTDFGNNPIIGASFSDIELDSGFIFYSDTYGNGTYTVNIEVNNVPSRVNPYLCNFTISKLGKEPQKVILSIEVILLNTVIEIISSVPTIKRLTGLNQTIYLYFNSTLDGLPIPDLTTDDVKVYDDVGSLWLRGDHNWTLIPVPAEDYYILNVSTSGLDSGEYTITLNISKYPIYNFNTSPVTFRLLGNSSQSNLETIEVDGIELLPIGLYNYYNATLGSDIDVQFNITDLDYGNNLVLDSGSAAIITVTYNKTSGTPSSGTLIFIRYAATFYRGNIDLSSITEEGNYTITISIELVNYEIQSFSFNLTLTERAEGPAPFAFEDLIPYFIIVGAAAAVGVGSIAAYRGLVVPKKREKKRALTEVRTIFDDAINLEHILVLYKGTGTCVFFKSFGSEAIDPELISGFISAVSSFGKEMVAQKALNEITYGDKMLLLADGEYSRVALVLSKKASIILRKHLTEFIAAFEKIYENELPRWRGQLNVFRNSGVIIDDVFNTSIILPHKITYEFSEAKTLKTPHSKDVLKVAHSCCEEAERDFFFIATLLKEATERTKKDTAEIFSGIKELRDKKILMPIEISTIEAQPISQQELNLISQKVAGLVSLSPEEKQKLVNDLAQMGPAEREAYFASIVESQEIVSAPMKVGVVKIEDLKSAKKEIKNLKKNAALARKENDYDKAITICQNALMIATNWEIQKEFEELEDLIRTTKIIDYKAKLKELENGAKLAAKEGRYSEAAQKFRMASRVASEIFKLGVTEMTKEVKRLSNKSKEYEKLI
ncbi:MAG: hypothetical protein ACFE8L_00145 [Candidatus Hodarchaeota archaeon]